MKKFLPFSWLLLSACLSNATTHTVDSTVGSGAQFNNIASAISAATDGDTILVHSSQYSYGTVYINKSVALIGPGHRPAVNQNLPASVTNFILINGCSGSLIEGFFIGNIEGAVFNVAHNITIRNNYFNSGNCIAGNYGDNSGSDNWLIEGNVMVDPALCGGCVMIDVRSSAAGNDNWTFRNNIIQIGFNANHMVANANATTTFANNIFVHNSSAEIFTLTNNSIFENNIFWSNSSVTNLSAGSSNCLFNNNLFYNPSLTLDDIAGVGNVMNQNPLFASLQDGLVLWNYSNDYHLTAGSPAIGAAADGDDLGLYGASYNFRMEGCTNDIPRLTEVLPQYLVVPQNGSFTIDFSAKGAGQ